MSDAGSTVIDRLNRALEGRYRVERELGAGGMATVYLAEDLKHHRRVAIKVLKPELAAVVGAERFLAEIETTAGLQHPGILPLFDSGEADGAVFFVMPYVEDETLRQRIDRERQLPVAEAVRIATEVAEALDYAHRQGIVHRDIKPANILLREGRPLVADFGIALAASRAGGAERLTETGMSLGTPYYMSPEQATGSGGVETATDVYALGCVLYEMLVGEPPYTGSTPQAVLGKIITATAEPPSAARKTVPLHIDAAIARATEKIPADRFRTAGDFARALSDPSYRYGAVGAAPTGASAPWKWAAIAASVVAVVALGALAAGLGSDRSDPRPVVRHRIAPIAEGMPRPLGTFTAVAPDGSSMVYAVPENPGAVASELRWQLWLQRRDREEATPLPGTEGGQNLAYSPDGSSIVYVAGPQLRRRPVADGSPVTLAEGLSPGPTSMIALAWMDDGTILFELPGSTLMRVAEEGGTADTVQVFGVQGLGFEQLSYAGPLPGSRGALLTICPQACAQTVDLAVIDFEADTTRTLLTEVVRGWYTPTGHLVYVRRDGGVFAAPFDLDALDLTGPGVPLFEGVAVDVTSPQMIVSWDGTVLFARGPGSLGAFRELVWTDRAGTQVRRSAPSLQGPLINLSLSPDDDRIALTMGDSTTLAVQLFVKELPDGPLTRLTADSGFTRRPVWSADGSEITYITNETGPYELRRLPADGSTSGAYEVVLTRSGAGVFEAVYTPDGRRLVFREGNANVGDADLLVLDLETGDVEGQILASDFNERAVSLSPDGRWVAYVSDASGRDEVFVRPFVGQTYQVPVSTQGGTNPVWAHNGREIFYIDGGGQLSVATYRTDPSFEIVSREALFDATPYYQWSEDWRRFDVTSDDEQLVWIQGVQVESDAEDELSFVYVQNFFAELPPVESR